jgi:hypothetical protein
MPKPHNIHLQQNNKHPLLPKCKKGGEIFQNEKMNLSIGPLCILKIGPPIEPCQSLAGKDLSQ